MSVNTIKHSTVVELKCKTKYIIINTLYIRPGAGIKLIFGRLNRSFSGFFLPVSDYVVRKCLLVEAERETILFRNLGG